MKTDSNADQPGAADPNASAYTRPKLTKKEMESELNRRDVEAAQAAADEEIIAAKVEAGLSRQQAIAVIKRQRECDAHRAKHVLPAQKKSRADQAKRNAALQHALSGGQFPE